MSPKLPEPTFRVLVEQLAIMALSELGRIPNPVTGQAMVSLDRARFTIGLLDTLAAKTRGGLESDESAHLSARRAELKAALAETEFNGGAIRE